MTPEQIRSLVLEKLLQVAPDIDPTQLDAGVPVRDQYDFDSMDFLNLVIALGKAFQVDIPEADYQQLQTLEDTVEYLRRRT